MRCCMQRDFWACWLSQRPFQHVCVCKQLMTSTRGLEKKAGLTGELLAFSQTEMQDVRIVIWLPHHIYIYIYTYGSPYCIYGP